MKTSTIIIFLLIVVSIGLVAFAIKDSTKSESTMNAQTIKVGEVTVSAFPIKTKNKFDIEIQLDTHSAELAYILDEISLLKNDSNETLKPIAWEGDTPSGHHVQGKLIFPSFSTKTKSVFLVIDSIENEKLEFNWEL